MKTNEKGYPLPETIEEYWKEFYKWKKRMKKIRKKVMKDPSALDEFENIMWEAVDRDLLEEDYVRKKLKKLYDEFNMSEKFKQDLRSSKSKAKKYIKDRAKKWFGKTKKDNVEEYDIKDQ